MSEEKNISTYENDGTETLEEMLGSQNDAEAIDEFAEFFGEGGAEEVPESVSTPEAEQSEYTENIGYTLETEYTEQDEYAEGSGYIAPPDYPDDIPESFSEEDDGNVSDELPAEIPEISAEIPDKAPEEIIDEITDDMPEKLSEESGNVGCNDAAIAAADENNGYYSEAYGADNYSEENYGDYDDEEYEDDTEPEYSPAAAVSTDGGTSADNGEAIGETFKSLPRRMPAPAPAPTSVIYTREKTTEVRTERKTEKNRSGALGIAGIIVSCVTLCAVGAAAFFGLGCLRRIGDELQASNARLNELEAAQKADYAEVINVIESEKEEPKEDDEITLGKGKILLYDSTVGYTWSPIISGIPLNNYDPNSFILSDDNRMTYMEDGEESSYFGIDVSSYQKEIDWNKVRADGVEFAILRIGLRGYGEEGNTKQDEYFVDNYDGAHAAGIDVGVYFFSQSISVEEAVEEARLVLEWLDGRKLEYPVVFDWEPAVTLEDDVARTEDLMPETLTLSAIAFCETIREAGYDAMIYTNKKLAVLKYDMRQLSCYPVWLASYRPELTYPYDFDIWQYGLGYVDGIEGEVDFNIAMIK